MYFPTDPEDNRDEAAVPAGLQKLNSPFAGFGVQPLPYPRLGLNGIPPTDKPAGPNQVGNTAIRQPETTPKLSFAQRIAALGQNPFSGPFASQNQNAESTPKVGIGHRIMGTIGQQPDTSAAARPMPLPNATPEMWRSRPQPLPALNPLQPARMELLKGKPSTSGFNNGQRYGEFFSDFVPAGADQSVRQGIAQPFQARDGQQAFDFRGRPVSTLAFGQVDQQSPKQQTTQPQPQPSMPPENPLLPDYLTGRNSETFERLKQAADYLKWRNQNFRPSTEGGWEAPSGRLYSDQQLRVLYAAEQQEAASAQRRREQERYATAQARPGSITITYTDGIKERRTGNHPQRDNNPGNIEYKGDFAKKHGAVGNDRGIAIFPSAEAGWAALDADLRNNYWNLTINQAIAKYAPKRDSRGKIINNTEKYQKDVRTLLGVTGDTKISSLKPDQFESLKQTIARLEGFYDKRLGNKVDVVIEVPSRPNLIPRRQR